MSEIWQHVVVTAAALAAIGILVRRRLRGGRGCADCALTKGTGNADRDAGPPGDPRRRARD